MSIQPRVPLTSRKDTMVTADVGATADVVQSRPSRHVQIATDLEAQRRLQALDECGDSSCDSGVPVQLTCSKTSRRPVVLNVVDTDTELGPWSASVGACITADLQQQQQLSHSGKTNRPRQLIAEVITAHSAACSLHSNVQ